MEDRLLILLKNLKIDEQVQFLKKRSYIESSGW